MCGAMYREDGQQLNEEEYIESFPLGFQFKPTDEELVQSYLMRKIKNLKLPCNRIREVDLYKFPTPQSLVEKYALIKNRESKWYFFSPRIKKYLNGDRPNRITPGGYWKLTGRDAPVCSRGQTIGKKRTLCFYEGKPTSAKKTNWIMHEFRINEQGHTTSYDDSMKLDDWVLCKVFERNIGSNATTQRDTTEVCNDANQQSLE
ncbi:hypothetical protein CDL12_20702 [Handroanthus impetiginosus]|uniref:NAC domain-containing protein n=1 Tax=Handroanthus impetiginosus TaxID=429701 RepID=A0A2G9GNE4_9LAMI|nr:hypothetical protein CDL12_20702 [Handroanthus impetiginosus]